MPRGPRKSQKEKLQEQLSEVISSIKQYEDAILTMKEQKKNLEAELKAMEVGELVDLMSKNDLTIDEMKLLIQNYHVEEQSA